MHLALTNDEGWRLEIPGLEELTTVGSKRCFGENQTCHSLNSLFFDTKMFTTLTQLPPLRVYRFIIL